MASSDHMSKIPPVTSSSRCSCSLLFRTMGWSSSVSRRQSSLRFLYVGENHAHGARCSTVVSVVSSSQRVSFPHRRPAASPLNRLVSRRTVACPMWSFGSLILTSVGMFDDNRELTGQIARDGLRGFPKSVFQHCPHQ